LQLNFKGRIDEAEDALRLYSKRAGGCVDEQILAEIRQEIENEKKNRQAGIDSPAVYKTNLIS